MIPIRKPLLGNPCQGFPIKIAHQGIATKDATARAATRWSATKCQMIDAWVGAMCLAKHALNKANHNGIHEGDGQCSWRDGSCALAGIPTNNRLPPSLQGRCCCVIPSMNWQPENIKRERFNSAHHFTQLPDNLISMQVVLQIRLGINTTNRSPGVQPRGHILTEIGAHTLTQTTSVLLVTNDEPQQLHSHRYYETLWSKKTCFRLCAVPFACSWADDRPRTSFLFT